MKRHTLRPQLLLALFQVIFWSMDKRNVLLVSLHLLGAPPVMEYHKIIKSTLILIDIDLKENLSENGVENQKHCIAVLHFPVTTVI